MTKYGASVKSFGALKKPKKLKASPAVGGKIVKTSPGPLTAGRKIDSGPLQPGNKLKGWMDHSITIPKKKGGFGVKPPTDRMPSKLPTAQDLKSNWKSAEKTYSGGRWAKRVHADGSRYYRDKRGDLFKVWDNGARELKKGSRRKPRLSKRSLTR